MATKHVISAKVSAEMLERLDALAKRLSDAAKGAPVTRHAATLIAIEHGLTMLEPKVKK